MYKIIKNPADLPKKEMNEFAKIFWDNNYEILTTLPADDNVPDLLSLTLQDEKNYHLILDDPNATFTYFSIKYKTGQNEEIIIPVGAFGITDKWKVRFPLVVNGIWQLLLMVNKDTFCKACNISESNDGNFYFSRLIEWRKEFILNIFKYYLCLDGGFCSGMSWKARGEKSNTRKIAESLTFHRISFSDMELYSSVHIENNADLVQYFKNCLFRWDVIGRNVLQDQEYPANGNSNIILLVKSIIGYHT